MPLLLRRNGFNNFFAVSFHSFCSSFFLLSFFLVGLEYCTLKSLEHFSFNSVRWGGSWYFRPSSRGGLANFTPIAGMGHLISKINPNLKFPPPLPPANFWQVPKRQVKRKLGHVVQIRICVDVNVMLNLSINYVMLAWRCFWTQSKEVLS